jgi:hypothetical protein
MVRKKRQFIGYGFDPGESSHHFNVVIPSKEEYSVTIEERFDWNEEAMVDAPKAPAVKVRLDRYRWERIGEAARDQFNKRIRAGGHRSVSWNIDQPNILAPHFGKELTLLAWAVEDMDESLIPNVIANWTGLEPEERWWLYTTVNATFTKADIGKDRGWRKAIRIAFSENPVPEMPGERFVEEPEPIKLPQKDDVPQRESVVGSFIHRKKKRASAKKTPQIALFEDV